VAAHANFTGTPQGTNPAAAYRPPPPTRPRKRRRPSSSNCRATRCAFASWVARWTSRRLPGFYRSLEESPFLGGVQFSKTETMVEDGKEIRQFTLDVLYTRPDSTLLKRVPLNPPPK